MASDVNELQELLRHIRNMAKGPFIGASDRKRALYSIATLLESRFNRREQCKYLSGVHGRCILSNDIHEQHEFNPPVTTQGITNGTL